MWRPWSVENTSILNNTNPQTGHVPRFLWNNVNSQSAMFNTNPQNSASTIPRQIPGQNNGFRTYPSNADWPMKIGIENAQLIPPSNSQIAPLIPMELGAGVNSSVASYIEEEIEKEISLFSYKSMALRFGNPNYYNMGYIQPPETNVVLPHAVEMVKNSAVSASTIEGYSCNSYNTDLELGKIPNPNNNTVIINGPKDTVTKLRFMKGYSDILAAAAWDGTVRFWNVSQGCHNIVFNFLVNVNCVVLDLDWTNQGQLIMGHSDGNVSLIDLTSRIAMTVGMHTGPVKAVASCGAAHSTLLISGSYDGSVKIWDSRAKRAIYVHNANGKVYGLQYKNDTFAFINSGGNLSIYSIGNPPLLQSNLDLNNGFPLRSLVLEDLNQQNSNLVAAVGTTNGRVYVTSLNRGFGNFSFKAHRHTTINQQGSLVAYPVHDLAFQPQSKRLGSGGGDGLLTIWDLVHRVSVYTSKQETLPITTLDYNNGGDTLAYAVGYDWSRGIRSYKTGGMKPEIYLKKCQVDLN